MSRRIGFLLCCSLMGADHLNAQVTPDFTAPYHENFDSLNFVPGFGGNNLNGSLDSNWNVTPPELAGNGTTQYSGEQEAA